MFSRKEMELQQTYKAAAEVFEAGERPTAVYFTSDILAVGAMQYFYEKNIRIPDDISIIGFDNTYSAIVPPKFTTVANHFDEIGKILIVHSYVICEFGATDVMIRLLTCSG
jgi:LacI family transcriptional regulator